MSRSYADFEPECQYKTGEAQDIIEFQLKDFKKEHLKVHLGSNGVLTVSGERPVDGNRWTRFRKEFHPPKEIKASEIKARFSSGILYITIPKKGTSQEPQQEQVTPVPQTPIGRTPTPDEKKLQEEKTISQSRGQDTVSHPAKTSIAKQPSVGDVQQENATMPKDETKSLISWLKMEKKTTIKVVTGVIVLSLVLAVLFYVFKFYAPMIMKV